VSVPGWPVGMTSGAIDDVRNGRGLPPVDLKVRLIAAEGRDYGTSLYEEALDRIIALEAALFLALDVLGDFEPNDARAFSDAYVAMAVIACDQNDDDKSADAIIQAGLRGRNNPNARQF